jgi:hypothetical protein
MVLAPKVYGVTAGKLSRQSAKTKQECRPFVKGCASPGRVQ